MSDIEVCPRCMSARVEHTESGFTCQSCGLWLKRLVTPPEGMVAVGGEAMDFRFDFLRISSNPGHHPSPDDPTFTIPPLSTRRVGDDFLVGTPVYDNDGVITGCKTFWSPRPGGWPTWKLIYGEVYLENGYLTATFYLAQYDLAVHLMHAPVIAEGCVAV